MSLSLLFCLDFCVGANSVSVVERTRVNLTCFTRAATSPGQGSWSELTLNDSCFMHVVKESLFCVPFLKYMTLLQY